MKRKLVCVALALAFLLVLPGPAFAADGAVEWSIDGRGVLSVAVTGDMPDYYKTSPPWDARRSEVKSIELAEGVTSIGAWAFSQCAAAKVTLPQSLRAIGEYAFQGCARLRTVAVPEGVTEISRQCFDHCTALESVSLPEGLTGIGESAFNCCVELESLSLPASLEKIGASAFNGCSALETVYYSGTEKQWNKLDLGSYNKPLTKARLVCGSMPAAGADDAIIDIACHSGKSFALRRDGTVLAAGMDTYSELDLEDWTDIVQIVVTDLNTFGLRSDGAVVVAGAWSSAWRNSLGTIELEELPFTKWTDITAIAASNDHLIGLKEDGAVVIEIGYGNSMLENCRAADVTGLKNMTQIIAGSYPASWYTGGINASGEACVNGEWFATDAVEISSSGWATLALRSDGTVIGTGEDYWLYEDELATWTDLKQVLPDDNRAYGLKEDGTVLFAGVAEDLYGLSKWTDIAELAANGYGGFVGIKTDGTVVRAGKYLEEKEYDVMDSWTDIVKVALSIDHVLGLRADGTVVAAGRNGYSQCDVEAWND